MTHTTHLLVAICLLAPATAMAQYVDQSVVHPANANFKNVPTWSDADISAQFQAMRDTRYLYATSNPSFARRISWLYPQDGCQVRAELAASMAGDAGKVRPYKLFVFAVDQNSNSLLRLYTANDPSGVVTWPWHVAPVVKNTAGEPIVLDPAMEPCRPLPWKEWLANMVDDMSIYDQPSCGVTVADSNAYDDMSLVTGNSNQRDDALYQEDNVYLDDEWNLQSTLLRNPTVVLGSAPPWSGTACVKTTVQYTTATVPENGSASVISTCPFATLNLGGGLMLSSNTWLVYKNARSGNGWEIDAKNVGSTSASLTSSAVCLVGAPTKASVKTVTGSKVTIGKGAYNSTTATCSSGVLVGGGFLTTVAGSPSSIMRIFLSGRTDSTGKNWRVSAYNTTSSNRDVTSYAYCLSNTNASLSQTSGNLTADGIATANCQAPLHALGGGFVFPRTTAYTVLTMDSEGDDYAVDMLPAPSGGDSNAKAYAECMTNP